MTDFLWKKKERLNEQLNFFGYKNKRFVSVYASKPKITVDGSVRKLPAHTADYYRQAIGIQNIYSDQQSILNQNLMAAHYGVGSSMDSILRGQQAGIEEIRQGEQAAAASGFTGLSPAWGIERLLRGSYL